MMVEGKRRRDKGARLHGPLHMVLLMGGGEKAIQVLLLYIWSEGYAALGWVASGSIKNNRGTEEKII